MLPEVKLIYDTGEEDIYMAFDEEPEDETEIEGNSPYKIISTPNGVIFQKIMENKSRPEVKPEIAEIADSST